jgi:TRAP transporter TAXI family solute receptor
MFKKVITIMVAFAVAMTFGFSNAEAKKPANLIIATATTGGTFYPVGVAIGTLISIKLAGKDKITATAINSAGSGENVQMLKNKEADFGILQALFGLEAYTGTGKYDGNPQQNLRAVTMLWKNVEHFPILIDYVKTGTITDIKTLPKKFSIGKRGSGTEGSGRTILKALDIDPDSIDLEYLGYNPSAQAMMDKRVVGANIPAGVPAAAITQLYAQLGEKKVKLLEFTDEQVAQIQKKYPIWTREVIKAGAYPGLTKPVNTIAQPNLLVVRDDLPEEVVYKVTKTIYENLPFLQNIHKATKAMSLEDAIKGLPVPLHPGALKYYKEKGLNIPAHLIAK